MFGYKKEDLLDDLRWLKRFIPFILVVFISTLLGQALAVLTVKGIEKLIGL